MISVFSFRPVMVFFMGRNLDTYTSTSPEICSRACSSVSPTVPIGGWMKTADGTCTSTERR